MPRYLLLAIIAFVGLPTAASQGLEPASIEASTGERAGRPGGGVPGPGSSREGTTQSPRATPSTYDAGYFGALEWRSVGPNRGGRSIAVSGVPGRPLEASFGAVGGAYGRPRTGARRGSPSPMVRSTARRSAPSRLPNRIPTSVRSRCRPTRRRSWTTPCTDAKRCRWAIDLKRRIWPSR